MPCVGVAERAGTLEAGGYDDDCRKGNELITGPLAGEPGDEAAFCLLAELGGHEGSEGVLREISPDE